MSNPPIGKRVVCPNCEHDAVAVLPRGSAIVEQEENADGKVWVNCRNCGNRFLVHYRTD